MLENSENITEQYQFKSDSETNLIVDKPSKPLTKMIKKQKDVEVINAEIERELESNESIIEIKNESIIEIKNESIIEIKNESIIEKKNIVQNIKSNKEIYETYVKELKYFSLILNNEIIYDSSIDKTGIIPIKFECDYFILFGKKYSYNGLKIQKINKK